MAASNRVEPTLPNWLVANRNFVLLWLAYGIAAFGDHLSEMAMLKERGGLARPDVTRVQALMTFGFFLPFVILAPFAGWWSDRFSRRSTMIMADLLRAVLVFNLAWVLATLEYWLPPSLDDLSIVIPLVVIGALAAFFSPARQALLPSLIKPDQLVRANAMINALGTIASILSAIVGGLLVNWGLQHENFHINAGTFLLSAACVWGINMKLTRASPHPPLEGVFQPMKAGFRYVLTHRRTLQLILLASIYWGAAGVGVSVVPAIGKMHFGEDYAKAAALRGVLAVGLATGAAVMTIVGATLSIQLAFLLGLTSAAFWLVMLGLNVLLKGSEIVTGVCLFGMGGAGAAILVTVMATLQRVVPDSRRGRVFGVSDMSTMAAMVLTSGLLGLPNIPNLDTYVPWILAATGVALFIAAVFCWRDYRHGSPLTSLAWVVLETIRFHAAFWYRTQREGHCTIPPNGPVIVAANHTAGVDALAILATSPNRVVSFLVERDFYQHPLAGAMMRINKCIPIDREKPEKSSIVAALRMLEDGGCLGVFPEGTYAPPGSPQPEAKDGVGALALRSGATVIPVHLSGTIYDDRPLRSLFRRHNIRVRYGRPVPLDDLRAAGRDADAREATARIMSAIRGLGAQT